MPVTSLTSSGLVINQTAMNQTRITAHKDGVAGFLVTSVVSARGQLPDPNVFLMEIYSESDKTQDAFVAVIKSADFNAYPSSRDYAIASGVSRYRTSSVSSFYTDITTARNAATAFKTDVDALVREWLTYTYQFAFGPPGDFIFLPESERTVIASLVSNWQRAHTAALTASVELEAARDAYQLADAALTAASTHVTRMQTLLDTINALADVPTVNPIPDPLLGDINIAAQLVVEAKTERDVADGTYQRAVQEQTAAESAYEVAVLTEAQALSAVRDEDPQFDPNNPTASLV